MVGILLCFSNYVAELSNRLVICKPISYDLSVYNRKRKDYRICNIKT